jgi:mannan endo-1,4-beta-mannosidase
MKFEWVLLGITLGLSGSNGYSAPPVTPDAAPEAVALLKYIQSLSGQHTLTGQHNFPNTKDTSTLQAVKVFGKTPAIYGQDFGFAAAGDKDAITARPDIIAECRRQWQQGSIITLCWHAVPPTADEPVTFRPKPGSSSTNKLASVQGQLTDEQWNDLLTPGTALHQHWCEQVDVIADYLKQLRDAHIPVLWRPYHEMNGDWFWWGGRSGPRGTVALYRQLFERLARHHQLNNLIWIWSVDRPGNPERQFVNFFPGTNCFDIASLDVYRNDFDQSYYDGLLKLADGKPIALAEVGPAPSLETLQKQPQWTWWMLWSGMAPRGSATNALQTLVNDPRSWSLSDPEYVKSIAPLRAKAGLKPLSSDR